jgi:hypothetical protein
MKIYIIAISLLFISSCSFLQKNNIAQGYTETFYAIKNAVVGFEDPNISLEIINKIPYASMLLKIGKGPKGLLILESISQDEQTWISADSVYIVTKGGRIVRTEGLKNDLVYVIFPELNFEEMMKSDLRSFNAFYSYDNPVLNNLELKVSYEIKDKQIVKLLKGNTDLILIEENISNSDLGWNFTNKYWIDQVGEVWKSEQYISPKLPIFSIEITKKPS